ncbi:hypothetical protein KM043_002493 [Ampulex compressa]|nr:hypothetical protein KM043_002493 [Ampulex compressa]
MNEIFRNQSPSFVSIFVDPLPACGSRRKPVEHRHTGHTVSHGSAVGVHCKLLVVRHATPDSKAEPRKMATALGPSDWRPTTVVRCSKLLSPGYARRTAPNVSASLVIRDEATRAPLNRPRIFRNSRFHRRTLRRFECLKFGGFLSRFALILCRCNWDFWIHGWTRGWVGCHGYWCSVRNYDKWMGDGCFGVA